MYDVISILNPIHTSYVMLADDSIPFQFISIQFHFMPSTCLRHSIFSAHSAQHKF